jgi:hypothetical protein
MEIGTISKVPATPSVVQPIAKPINPLRGGTGLQIIPLPVQIFIIFVSVTTIVNQTVEGNERFDKKQNEPINLSFSILDSRLEFLEFISINILLTPHQIGIGQEVTLIFNTLHALEVFTTPIVTFEDTLDRPKIVAPTDLQINQVKLVEVIGVEFVKKIISQLVTES